MALTPRAVTVGAGRIYIGAYGATEPTETAINTAPPSSSWTEVGGTIDGVNVNLEQSFTTIYIDQIADPVQSALTERMMKVVANAAENTLETIKTAWNGGTIASGSGYRTLDPVYGGDEVRPTYIAVLFDGYAPASAAGVKKRRRFIVRKVIDVDNVESPYKKDGATVIPLTLGAHYIDDSTAPYRIIDET